ncbi:hypothetical protein OAF45_03455, partial [Candidatus Latescibacteria bacterium]|nr:hypothetical protein [Candidatus Latescibacterota bacterium]
YNNTIEPLREDLGAVLLCYFFPGSDQHPLGPGQGRPSGAGQGPQTAICNGEGLLASRSYFYRLKIGKNER